MAIGTACDWMRISGTRPAAASCSAACRRSPRSRRCRSQSPRTGRAPPASPARRQTAPAAPGCGPELQAPILRHQHVGPPQSAATHAARQGPAGAHGLGIDRQLQVRGRRPRRGTAGFDALQVLKRTVAFHDAFLGEPSSWKHPSTQEVNTKPFLRLCLQPVPQDREARVRGAFGAVLEAACRSIPTPAPDRAEAPAAWPAASKPMPESGQGRIGPPERLVCKTPPGPPPRPLLCRP